MKQIIIIRLTTSNITIWRNGTHKYSGFHRRRGQTVFPYITPFFLDWFATSAFNRIEFRIEVQKSNLQLIFNLVRIWHFILTSKVYVLHLAMTRKTSLTYWLSIEDTGTTHWVISCVMEAIHNYLAASMYLINNIGILDANYFILATLMRSKHLTAIWIAGHK